MHSHLYDAIKRFWGPEVKEVHFVPPAIATGRHVASRHVGHVGGNMKWVTWRET